jgi:hypothetical protein
METIDKVSLVLATAALVVTALNVWLIKRNQRLDEDLLKDREEELRCLDEELGNLIQSLEDPARWGLDKHLDEELGNDDAGR